MKEKDAMESRVESYGRSWGEGTFEIWEEKGKESDLIVF